MSSLRFPPMQPLLNFLQSGDLCSLASCVLIFLWLGERIVRQHPDCRVWGIRLAGMGFIAFAAYSWVSFPPAEGPDFVRWAIGSLAAAGFTLAIAWIALPILGFLWANTVRLFFQNLRTAIAHSRQRRAERRARWEAERRRPLEEAERRRAAADAARYQRQLEQQRGQQEAERKKQQEALKAKKDAPRQHLLKFYAQHKDLLQDAYPPALLAPFVRSEMPDTFTPEQLWKICQDKIAQLQPLLRQERDRKRQDDQRQARQQVRLKKLDEEIAFWRQAIDRLQASSLERETIEDEAAALLERIRGLEEKRDLLLTLDHGEES